MIGFLEKLTLLAQVLSATDSTPMLSNVMVCPQAFVEALKSVAWVMVLVTIVVYVFAILGQVTIKVIHVQTVKVIHVQTVKVVHVLSEFTELISASTGLMVTDNFDVASQGLLFRNVSRRKSWCNKVSQQSSRLYRIVVWHCHIQHVDAFT